MIFDLDLITQLNEEYAQKPTVPAPPGLAKDARVERARREAARLDKLVGLRDQTVLEIGCGEGDLSFDLAQNYSAKVTGIDVRDLESWNHLSHPNLRLMKCDVSAEELALPENGFSRIISHAVWEHIRHPFTALRNCQRLLQPLGKKYLYANLYRSSIASHLYREIYFPWPHLLFTPESLARSLKTAQIGWAFWVNKLTYAQYLQYFRKLGFYITHERLTKRPIDEGFYGRFEQRLGLYPRSDLELDFFEVVLEFDPIKPKSAVPDPLYRTSRSPTT